MRPVAAGLEVDSTWPEGVGDAAGGAAVPVLPKGAEVLLDAVRDGVVLVEVAEQPAPGLWVEAAGFKAEGSQFWDALRLVSTKAIAPIAPPFLIRIWLGRGRR